MSATGDSEQRGGDLAERARVVLGHGLHRAALDERGLPCIVERAEGATLFAADGRRWTDWVMAWGAALLGYRHPEVEAAVRAQLGRGTLMSLPHRLEVEVAERLLALLGWGDKVVFGKNGSDVTLAAVRVARVVTGRDGILTCGYHGFHDWFQASNAAVEGVPAALRALVHAVPFDDVATLRGILDQHGARIAALILEPTRTALPSAGWLAAVRALTREHGVLLVFDEMVTGFRIARGGAMAAFGVRPDLACFGKALANGLPLAALVGPAALIDVAPRVGCGMTARGEPLAFAAARAALDVYAQHDVAGHVRGVGEALRGGVAAIAERSGRRIALTGHPALLTFDLPDAQRAGFLAGCLRRGVHSNGHLLPSLAHGAAEVTASLAAFEAAWDACAHEA